MSEGVDGSVREGILALVARYGRCADGPANRAGVAELLRR
jgi:hypothetical protein